MGNTNSSQEYRKHLHNWQYIGLPSKAEHILKELDDTDHYATVRNQQQQ